MSLKTEIWPIEKLIPYSRNPRKNDEQVDKMVSAIKEFGFRIPIIAKSDGSVVDGHLRLKAAQKLGMKEIPVSLADELSDAQIKAFRLLANRSANWAEWDNDLLKLELQELGDMDFDLELTGFDDIELGEILNKDSPIEGNTEDDAVPEVPETPVSKLGDIWILGNHRVMCGDSTDQGSVTLLMNGEKADLVFTDPPYKIETKGGRKGTTAAALRKQGAAIEFISDFSPHDLLKVLPEVFDRKKINAYVFCNKELLPDYLVWAREMKFSFNVLIWKKPSSIPIADSHRPDIEYLILFRKSAIWNNGLSGVNYSRCLEYGRESGLHPTMKPVDLICNEVKISSNAKGIVVDLFLGSGSTLIACEKTNRKCYGMELDPRYTDVICKRWQDFTGKEAVLESDQKTFQEVKDSRI